MTIIIITGKAQNQVQQPQTMTNTKKEATERELCTICIVYQKFTLWLYSEGIFHSFLVPTVDGTDCEGVLCPQRQSRTTVVLTGSHISRTSGEIRCHSHTIHLYGIMRVGGVPLKRDSRTSRREEEGAGGGGWWR